MRWLNGPCMYKTQDNLEGTQPAQTRITSTYRASSVDARVNFTVTLMPSKQMRCGSPSYSLLNSLEMGTSNG